MWDGGKRSVQNYTKVFLVYVETRRIRFKIRIGNPSQSNRLDQSTIKERNRYKICSSEISYQQLIIVLIKAKVYFRVVRARLFLLIYVVHFLFQFLNNNHYRPLFFFRNLIYHLLHT